MEHKTLYIYTPYFLFLETHPKFSWIGMWPEGERKKNSAMINCWGISCEVEIYKISFQSKIALTVYPSPYEGIWDLSFYSRINFSCCFGSQRLSETGIQLTRYWDQLESVRQCDSNVHEGSMMWVIVSIEHDNLLAKCLSSRVRSAYISTGFVLNIKAFKITMMLARITISP